MSEQYKLDAKELQFVKGEVQSGERKILKQYCKCNNLNLGDYLVLYEEREFGLWTDKKERTLSKNSYNAAHKFMVVYVDDIKISYAKRLNKKGKPHGELISCLTGRVPSGGCIWSDNNFQFELDPDYADAIILDSKDDFDPTEIHRNKSNAFKDVAKHNKDAKIPCHEIESICSYFDTLKTGDVLWTSPKKFYTVLATTKITYKQLPWGSNYKKTKKRMLYTQLTVQDHKGRERPLLPEDFWYCALYKAKPRSYAELKDPNL